MQRQSRKDSADKQLVVASFLTIIATGTLASDISDFFRQTIY